MLLLLPIPNKAQYIHGPCRRFRFDTRRSGKFLYNAIASTDNAQHKNCPSSGIDDRPGRDLFRVLKRSPISQPHTLGLRRRYSDGKAVLPCATTPTKIASALENFPDAVIMPSVWPDWSKFQFLRSWHDPAEIRTTRTTTYQTWSERSNH